MNVELEKTGNLTATLKIDLSPADYEENVNKVLKEYQKKAQMPGFRPGKVPFSLTKKMYGQAATADEINKLLSESLDNYIRENKLQLLGNPLANTEKTTQMDFVNPGEMSFYFDMAFTPEFSVNLTSDLNVPYYKISATDDMVKNYLEDIRRRQGEMKEVDSIESGDLVKGDFVELDTEGAVKEEGVKSTGSINTNQIKDQEIIDALKSAAIGSTITVDINKLAENDSDKATTLGITPELANGIDSKFNFTITSVTRMMPADMNEEFFDKVFPGEEIKDEQQMLERIRKEADQSFVMESDRKFFNDAIEKLISEANIELPDSFVKRWLVETNPDKLTAEDVERDYEGYSRSLKWQLIEGRILNENGVSVTDDEVKEVYRSYFRRPDSVEMDEETIKRIDSIADSFMKNREESARIRSQILEKKVIELIKEKLQPKEENLTYEEFVKLPSNK